MWSINPFSVWHLSISSGSVTNRSERLFYVFDIVCEVDLTFMKEWTSVTMMNINKDVEIKTIYSVDLVHLIRKSKEGIRSSILFIDNCFQRLLKFHDTMDNLMIEKWQKQQNYRDKIVHVSGSYGTTCPFDQNVWLASWIVDSICLTLYVKLI